MVIAGAKTENGQCKFLLRNSRGQHWPYIFEDQSLGQVNDPGGGYQWVNAQTLIDSTDNLVFTTIYPEDPEMKGNLVRQKSGKQMLGKTWQGKFY